MRPDNFVTYDSLAGLHLAAADEFCNLAIRSIDERGVFRVSLSGGSTPKRLYEMLSERQLPWEKVHWYWGDERNVPLDHEESNFKMVRCAILESIDAPESNVHRVPVNIDAPASAAIMYEHTLRSHFPDSEFPHWDLVLLGMGDDAHTASLFPETSALTNTDRWFVENWVEKFDAFRYTLTAPAINSGRERWFLIAGASKQAALDHVFSSPRQPLQYPSQLIGATRWFVHV